MKIDIFISGGGVAGLVAAVAFGDAGFSVLCVDPVAPITDRTAYGADLRTTAYLQPAQAFLNQINLWPHVKDHSQALQVMRILDADKNNPKDFKSSDISDQPFGWNVGNWQMRAGLLTRLAELPNVDFRPGVSTNQFMTRTQGAHATLSDGTKVSARMAIAADGRNSMLRGALGIAVKRTNFGQKALTFAVTHTVPHDNISTEVHRSGGPFTLVPLPDYEGKPCSAVVWMESEKNADTLVALDDITFNQAASERSAYINGDLSVIGKRTCWPIISQLTETFYGERTAIIAEAAHVVPPIGAQGLNMSLRDIETLCHLSIQDPDAIGTQDMLCAYHKARYSEVSIRIAGVGLLNRTSIVGGSTLRQIRAFGLDAIHGITPIRNTLMKLGLGTK